MPCEEQFRSNLQKKNIGPVGVKLLLNGASHEKMVAHLVKARAKNINLLQRKYFKASFKPKD